MRHFAWLPLVFAGLIGFLSVASSSPAAGATPRLLESGRDARLLEPGFVMGISDDGQSVLVPRIVRHGGSRGDDVLASVIDIRTGRRRLFGPLGINDTAVLDPNGQNIAYTNSRNQVVVQRIVSRRVINRYDNYEVKAITPGARTALVTRHRRGNLRALSDVGVLNLHTGAFSRLPASPARALRQRAEFLGGATMSADARFIAFNVVHSVDWQFWVVVDRKQDTYRFFPETGFVLSMSRNGRQVQVGTDHQNAYSIYDPVTQTGEAIPAYGGGARSWFSWQGGAISADGLTMTTTCGSQLYVHSLAGGGGWGQLPATNVRWSLLAGGGKAAIYTTPRGLYWATVDAGQEFGVSVPAACIDPNESDQSFGLGNAFRTIAVVSGRPDCLHPRGSSGGCDPQIPTPRTPSE